MTIQECFRWIQLAVQLLNRALRLRRQGSTEMATVLEVAQGLLVFWMSNTYYGIAFDPRRYRPSQTILEMRERTTLFPPEWEKVHIGCIPTNMKDDEPDLEKFRDGYLRDAIEGTSGKIEWHKEPVKVDVAAMIAADTEAESAPVPLQSAPDLQATVATQATVVGSPPPNAEIVVDGVGDLDLPPLDDLNVLGVDGVEIKPGAPTDSQLGD